LQDAALALGTPIVAHHDEVVYQRAGGGEGAGTEQARQRSLFVQAVSRVPDFRNARTSDFKSPGDLIYLLGSVDRLGLVGSELQFQLEGRLPRIEGEHSAPHPDWSLGRLLYGWVGGDFGDRQTRLRSLHDISEGGLLVALAEGLLARGYGAYITLPTDQEPWRFCFGEGFHAFVATCMDADSSPIEDELRANRIPFLKLGSVNTTGKLELRQGDRKLGAVDTARLRQAWNREGFWE
jgi:phosphoribosylformylglycinamidine synthase